MQFGMKVGMSTVRDLIGFPIPPDEEFAHGAPRRCTARTVIGKAGNGGGAPVAPDAAFDLDAAIAERLAAKAATWTAFLILSAPC